MRIEGKCLHCQVNAKTKPTKGIWTFLNILAAALTCKLFVVEAQKLIWALFCLQKTSSLAGNPFLLNHGLWKHFFMMQSASLCSFLRYGL